MSNLVIKQRAKSKIYKIYIQPGKNKSKKMINLLYIYYIFKVKQNRMGKKCSRNS